MKTTCLICRTPVEQEDLSKFAAYGGLPSPCCKVCFECNDHAIKNSGELAAKSLLKRSSSMIEPRTKPQE